MIYSRTGIFRRVENEYLGTRRYRHVEIESRRVEGMGKEKKVRGKEKLWGTLYVLERGKRTVYGGKNRKKMDDIGHRRNWSLLDRTMKRVEGWGVTVLSTQTAALESCFPCPRGLRQKQMDLNCMKIEIWVRHEEKCSNCKNVFELDYYGNSRISGAAYFYCGQDYRLREFWVSLMAYFMWFSANCDGIWALGRGARGRSRGTGEWALLYRNTQITWGRET